MPATESTRLTISWSKDTDLALRRFLGAPGLKKGALSAFIEDAMRWRLFEQTVETIKDSNAGTDPDELMVTAQPAWSTDPSRRTVRMAS